MINKIKTATDVLRVAVGLSDGDVSLATPTKFRNFNRSERRFLLNALNRTSNTTEDMIRWSEYWKRLARLLHPSDYASQMPNMAKGFDVVCNNKSFDTTNSLVERYLLVGDAKKAVDVLKNRPGDFARRLDHLLRIDSTSVKNTLTAFEEVVDKVSTPVLLQVMAHFRNRNVDTVSKTIFPKGNVCKMQVVETALPALSSDITNRIGSCIESTLTKRFGNLSTLGKVYVDDSMKDHFIPFSQRTAAKALRTLTRGSRVDIDKNTNFLRFFIWWKDGESRTDIDLAANLYDHNWKDAGNICYYNLKEMGAYHSGDITSAPKGAAEFIDIDINCLIKRGVRYVGMSVYSYTQQPYCDLPECFAGWMARSKCHSGEIFDARTVQDKIDLAGDVNTCIPLVFDLVDRKMIWADLGVSNRSMYVNSRSTPVQTMLKGIVELKKPTLYDLFMMHAVARGELVSSKEEADTVFSLYDGITPFNTDIIMKDFMQ